MKTVQIPYDLFLDLAMYHLRGEDDYEEEIRQGLEQKLDAMLNRQLYSRYKTAPTEEEREQAKKDMGSMLDYIDKLGELDTTGVEPMSHVFPVHNVFREDVVTNGDMREDILKNAPGEKDGMFIVPKTFE